MAINEALLNTIRGPDNKELVRLREIIKKYEGKISSFRIKRWANIPLFPVYRISKQTVLVDPDEVQKFIQEHFVEDLQYSPESSNVIPLRRNFK